MSGLDAAGLGLIGEWAGNAKTQIKADANKRFDPGLVQLTIFLQRYSSMAKVFCIANQKGGVGKTTTTVNLAAGLAQIQQRVLVVDLDPQGNATMGSGIDKRAMPLSIYDVLLESASIVEAPLH